MIENSKIIYIVDKYYFITTLLFIRYISWILITSSIGMFYCCDKPRQGIPFTQKYHKNTSSLNDYNNFEGAGCLNKTEMSQRKKQQQSTSLYARDNMI